VPDVAILGLTLPCSAVAGTPDDRFAELVGRRSRFVFQVAWTVLRNAHDAEDVAQETFLKLYRNGSWQRMEDERAFLARTAWRIAVSKTRGRRAECEVGDSCDRAASPERLAISADLNAAVQRLIDGLPEELRLPLALSAIEEMTSRAIGEAMGVPEGTIRTRIMRAREILRRKLEAL
jgi:RNA polymerase sigma-70 factor (ECF subfamily)